jgi:hypothetical protein
MYSSVYYTNLVNFINRIIIYDLQAFKSLLESAKVSFDDFIDPWFKKMEFLVSNESRRINLVAIYTLLPHFSALYVKKFFVHICKLTLPQID